MSARQTGGILVTGARGRIGGLLVDDLRARGHRVKALARTLRSSPHPDDIAVDLTDRSRVREVFAGSGACTLVHLAAVQRGDGVEATNARIDDAVAEGARAAEISGVLLASSAAVYGTNAATPRTEQAPLLGDSPYARSKVHSERLFADLVEQGAVGSALALRIFNVAGRSFPDSLVQRLIHADAANPVPVTEPDRFVRDYIHQDDLIELLRTALNADPHGYRAVNVGTGTAISTRMLLDSIRPPVDAITVSAGPASISRADVSAMTALFGLQPKRMPDRSWD